MMRTMQFKDFDKIFDWFFFVFSIFFLFLAKEEEKIRKICLSIKNQVQLF